jgi:DNA-binding NarL/FixJ family response regulator
MRIMLVDDHAPFRRELRALVDEQPDMLVVAEAADGEDAVDHALALRPDGLDLVLMDLEMPRLDGVAATRLIRARDPGLPVVLLTVASPERGQQAARDSGAAGLLSKALTPRAMLRALRVFQKGDASPPASTV